MWVRVPPSVQINIWYFKKILLHLHFKTEAMKLGLYTLIIESIFKKIPDLKIDFGYGNGYVLIPKEHPIYNLHYSEIELRNDYSMKVHGGLTYSDYFKADDFLIWLDGREITGDVTLENYKLFDGYWVIGFDTNHYNDNKQNCSKTYVIKETEKLLNQCLDDSIEGVKKYKCKVIRNKKLLKINEL